MKKSLVAYFSASGVTKKVAENLVEILNGDLFEIVPSELYSEEDLDWRNPTSRSSVEMKYLDVRPAIKNRCEDIDKYDVIYVGFPIWWYIAPTIINTFLESYNLEGKTIIPFATSGGSDMGKTNEHLVNSCKGAILKEGMVLDAKINKTQLIKFIEESKK